MAARGVGYVSYGLIAREIERVDSGYRSTISVQSSLVMHPIHAYGNEAQRAKHLPRLATGEIIGCFGLTEPDAAFRSRLDEDPGRARSMGATCSRGRRPGSATPRSPTSSWCGRRTMTTSFADSSWSGGMKGLSTPKIEGKFSLRGVGHRPDRDGRRIRSVRERAARCLRAQGGPFGCLTRARYGIAWGGARSRGVLLARGPRVRAGAPSVRPAAGRQPTRAEEARRHADRDCAGPRRVPAPRSPVRRERPPRTRRVSDAEAKLGRQGARHRAHGPRHATAPTASPTSTTSSAT